MTKQESLEPKFWEFSKKYGITPIQTYSNNIYRITFADYCFEAKGKTEEKAKALAVAKAVEHLKSLPIPDKPLLVKLKELVEVHGLDPRVYFLDDFTVKIKMGTFTVKETSTVQKVAFEKAMTACVKYLETLPVPATCPNEPTENESVAESECTTPTATKQEQTASSGCTKEEPILVEAFLGIPLDGTMTSEELKNYVEAQIRALKQAPENADPSITAVTHLDNGPLEILVPGDSRPVDTMRAFCLRIQSPVNLRSNFPLTLEEKERILTESLQDMLQEFESPQLLLETALNKGDSTFLDIMQNKINARVLENDKRITKHACK